MLRKINAHVGELSEVSDAHTGSVLDCPEVLETRRYVCNNVTNVLLKMNMSRTGCTLFYFAKTTGL